jgi:hypothetical protein
MGIEAEAAERMLGEVGFTCERGCRSDTYSLSLDAEWTITARAPFETAPAEASGTFFDTPVNGLYAAVEFTLSSRGTLYRCRTAGALSDHVTDIIEELRRVARDPGLLKCPKCGVRWVQAKEPSPGQSWKPFLSCEGMYIVGSGRRKQAACRGTSSKLPAVIECV